MYGSIMPLPPYRRIGAPVGRAGSSTPHRSPGARVRAGLCAAVRAPAGAGRPPAGSLLVEPAHGPLDGLEPLLVLALAGLGVHPGRPLGGPAPVGAQRVGVRPEA